MPASQQQKKPRKRNPWHVAPEVRQARIDALAPLFQQVKRQGRSYAWLARQLGVGVTAMNAYIRGWSRMPNHLLTQACDLIGLPRELLEAASPILITDPYKVIFDEGEAHKREKRAS